MKFMLILILSLLISCTIIGLDKYYGPDGPGLNKARRYEMNCKTFSDGNEGYYTIDGATVTVSSKVYDRYSLLAGPLIMVPIIPFPMYFGKNESDKFCNDTIPNGGKAIIRIATSDTSKVDIDQDSLLMILHDSKVIKPDRIECRVDRLKKEYFIEYPIVGSSEKSFKLSIRLSNSDKTGNSIDIGFKRIYGWTFCLLP